MNRMEKTYALYKDDEFIDCGSLRQLARRRGIKITSLTFHLMPAYQKRLAAHRDLGHRLSLVEVDDE